MLTKEITDEVKITNPSRRELIAPLLLGASFLFISFIIITGPKMELNHDTEPISSRMGTLLLTDHILPFELLSFLLLIGMAGTVYIVRYSHRDQKRNERDGSRK